jgi:hypothetical protein
LRIKCHLASYHSLSLMQKDQNFGPNFIKT